MDAGAWTVMLGFGIGAGLVATAVASLLPAFGDRPRARVRARLLQATGHRVTRDVTGTGDVSVFATDVHGPLGRLREHVGVRVIRLGGWRPVRLALLLALLAGAAVTLLLRGPFASSLSEALGGGLAAGAAIAWLALGQCARRWRIAYLENLSDAIDLVIRAVKAGIPVIEAVRTAGREVNEPVRSEFARITEAVDLGGDLKSALRRSAERVRIPDFDFFVVCLIMQRETGGQLAETLQGLSTVLRRRKELRLKTRALTAEGRLSVAIVGAIPVVAGLGMYALNPDYMGQLLEPGLGRNMLYAAIGCHLTGFAVAHRLTQVEP